MTDNKMDRLKHRFISLQGKLQDRMDEFQDQVQNKIERSKVSKFISHLSEEKRSSIEDNCSVESADKSSSDGGDTSSIPSFVIDEPTESQDPKQVCKDFIKIEQGTVLYKSRSACHLAYDDDLSNDSSSESCFSCLSSSDEKER